MKNAPRRKEKERVCMCVCVCVRSRFRDHGGPLILYSDSGKKITLVGGVCLRRNARGLGEWVGEKKQTRSCLGVTDLGITPYVDWTTAILYCTHAIGLHMARRNAVIMRGSAAHWHSRDLEIYPYRGVLCVNRASALVPMS
jgi:hypothetical protein